MEISVSFYEASNYTSKHAEMLGYACRSNPNRIQELHDLGYELQEIMIQGFFNGAEMAVEYRGANIDKEEFTFKLKAN